MAAMHSIAFRATAVAILGAIATITSVLPGCSTAQFDSAGQSSAAVSSQGQAALADLRARFVIKTTESKSALDDTKVVVSRPVFVASNVDRFDSVSAMLVPHTPDTPTKPATTRLPKSSGYASHVEDPTGVAVDLKLEGLSDVVGATIDGYAIYTGAMGGGHYAVRGSGEGLEDFVDLEVAPSAHEIVYDVTLGSKVAGLRLAGNSLEVLDSSGTPRLHVAPPFIVDSAGLRSDATLSVTGCKVDTTASGPWGRAMQAPGAATCKVHVGWSQSVSFPAVVDPSWTTTGSMVESRADHTGTLLNSGKTLVVGGLTAAGTCAGAELWDPATGTWAATGSPATKRKNHTGTLLSSGIVLIAGGINSSGVLIGSAELYDPSTGVWTTTGSFVDFPNAYATAHLLSNGNGIANGGFESGTLTGWTSSGAATSVTTTTPHSGTYSAMAGSTIATNGDSNISQTFIAPPQTTSLSFWYKMTCPDTVQYDWATATLVDNTPGGGGTTTPLPKICTSAAWTQVGASVVAGHNYTLTLTSHDDNYGADPSYTLFDDLEFSTGKVIYIGGRDDRPQILGGPYYTPNAELYDPTKGSWSFTGTMATGRAFHASALLPNGKVLVTGGATTYGSTTATVTAELYDPATATWSSAANMGMARYSHTITALNYGVVSLAAGGYASGTSNPMSSTETYDANSNAWTPAPVMSNARASHRAVVLPNSQVLLAGGFVDSSNTVTASADLFDQANRSLFATTAMPQAAASFSITPAGAVGTSLTLGAGGQVVATPTNAAWLFDIGGTVNTGTPIGDNGSAPVVFTTWNNPNAIGTFTAASTSFAATIQNNDSAPHTVYVDLVALGLDERTITRSQYFTLALAPKSSQVVNVPATAFPIRPVGSDAQLELQIRPYTTGGPTGEMYGADTPLYYEFSSDYSQIIVHGQIGKDLDRTQPGASTTQAAWLTSTSAMRSGLATVTGTIYSGTGFVNVSTQPPPTSGQLGAYNMRGQWASDFDALFPNFMADITFPSGTWYRMCPHWTVEYDDAGKGEDKLAVSGPWSPVAPYVHYIISQGGKIAAKGTVGGTGCSDPIQLNNGTYQLFWTSKMSRDDITTSISVSPGHGGYGCEPKKNPNGCLTVDAMETFVRSFVASGGGTQQLPVNLQYAASSEDFITRAAAVVGLSLAPSGDFGILSNHAYKVWADTGCIPAIPPTNGVGGACYNDDPLALALELGNELIYASDGTSTVGGRHTTFNKFVVAHEFGHNIQYTTWGKLQYDYECAGQNNTACQKWTSAPKCRCDLVSTGNRYHCLQSRQLQPFAEQEGFGHFFSSNLLNLPTNNNCKFVYYKDLSGVPPPNTVPCFYNSGPPQTWMHNKCATGESNMGADGTTAGGVEWDWLTFYWELHNRTSNAYALADLQNVYTQACNGNTSLCVGDAKANLFFDKLKGGHSSLKDAANTLFPGPKGSYFLVTGQKHGVDTP